LTEPLQSFVLVQAALTTLFVFVFYYLFDDFTGVATGLVVGTGAAFFFRNILLGLLTSL